MNVTRRALRSNLSLSAELVLESLDLRLAGILTTLETRGCVVELFEDTPHELTLGMPAWIELPTVEGARITGRLRQRLGRRVTVELKRGRKSDQRYFPRVSGGIEVEYRLVSNGATDAATRSWLRGLSVADDGSWFKPGAVVDFSPSGLRCKDGLGCAIGDLLLLALIRPGSGEIVRATGRVVRAWESERRGREIAVEFVEIPAPGLEALTHYTLERQLAFINGSAPEA